MARRQTAGNRSLSARPVAVTAVVRRAPLRFFPERRGSDLERNERDGDLGRARLKDGRRRHGHVSRQLEALTGQAVGPSEDLGGRRGLPPKDSSVRHGSGVWSKVFSPLALGNHREVPWPAARWPAPLRQGEVLPPAMIGTGRRSADPCAPRRWCSPRSPRPSPPGGRGETVTVVNGEVVPAKSRIPVASRT